jgi:hypothetical protein
MRYLFLMGAGLFLSACATNPQYDYDGYGYAPVSGSFGFLTKAASFTMTGTAGSSETGTKGASATVLWGMPDSDSTEAEATEASRMSMQAWWAA